MLEALEAGQAYRFASLDAPAPRDGEAGDTLGERLGKEDPELADAEGRAILSPLLATSCRSGSA